MPRRSWRHRQLAQLEATMARGWRALFFPEGFEHSLTSHAGVGWALSPWAAVQQAARDALAG